MYSALYYPHTAIQTEGILKTALLLWDKFEYISPFREYKAYYNDRDVEEAAELIIKPLLPTDKDKKDAHNKIISLVDSGLPEWFSFNSRDKELPYSIYPQKLLPETWELLRERNYASVGNHLDNNFATSNSFGLSIMAILANVCAGTQKDTVTDQIDNYDALTRYFTAALGGEYDYKRNDFERLVTISIKSIKTDSIDLKRLIELRKKEGSFLQELRTNYRKSVEEFVSDLNKSPNIIRDAEELERVFEQNISNDFNELKKALRLEIAKTIFSKELAVAIVAVAGITIEPISTSIIATGALIKKDIEYRQKRKEILKQHPSSWLYVSANQRQYL
jgi:hypothetical protein